MYSSMEASVFVFPPLIYSGFSFHLSLVCFYVIILYNLHTVASVLGLKTFTFLIRLTVSLQCGHGFALNENGRCTGKLKRFVNLLTAHVLV